MPIFAVTGATGFVGGHLLEAAAAAGVRLRALARRPQPERPNVTWIPGDLADEPALRCLLQGADAVIHIAGVTNARHAADFHAGNAEATARLARLAGGTANARLAGGTANARLASPLPFLHVSSLAAREPALSNYGASKKAAEDALAHYPGPLAIARPGAVYGPRDHDLLALFRTAARTGLAPLPANQRAAYIHARDLAEALLALAHHLVASPTALSSPPGGGVRAADGGRLAIDLCDGHPGHDATEVADALAHALDRRVSPVPVPPFALRLGARIDTLLAGSRRLPTLSRDRAAYLAHPDWTADPAPMQALNLWKPHLPLPAGFRDTASWYRAQGLLP